MLKTPIKHVHICSYKLTRRLFFGLRDLVFKNYLDSPHRLNIRYELIIGSKTNTTSESL